MPYFIFKCRKCRNLLFTTDNIVSSRGERFENLDPSSSILPDHESADFGAADQIQPPTAPCFKPGVDWCSNRIREEDECDGSLWFLDIDSSPDWIIASLEQHSYLRGKLSCPRCDGRIGNFDFQSAVLCQCNEHVIPSIRISKSRIDLCTATLAATPERRPVPPRNLPLTANPPAPAEDGSPSQDSVSLSSIESGYESSRAPNNANAINNASPPELQGISSPADDQDIALTQHQNQFSTLPIESLPPETVNTDKFIDYDTLYTDPDVEALTCSVCLELYFQPHKCEPCKHVYCGPCLRRLRASTPFNTKCPLCREIIWKCLPDNALECTVQSSYPQAYKARKSVERKHRSKLPPLPGCASGPLRFLSNSAQRYNRRPSPLFMWSGACFVLLLMVFGFTIFATTVGFFLWWLLEIAMDIFVDVFIEMNNFFDRAWQALIILCIEGQVPEQVNTVLAGSVRRMFASFGKLANRTKSFLNEGEYYDTYDVGIMRDHVVNMRDHVANETSQLLSRMAQASVANYLLAAILITYMVYRLARYMQRLPA